MSDAYKELRKRKGEGKTQKRKVLNVIEYWLEYLFS